MEPTRVLFIGRKTMCLEGLAAILTADPGIQLVGRTSDWQEGVTRTRTLEPEIVIVDMVHCNECGPSSPASCVSELTGSKVIVVGLPDADSGIIDAFEAGALGYLTLNGQSAEDIRRVINTVAAGEAALDPRLSAGVLARMRKLARNSDGIIGRDAAPTDREQDVLALLVEGNSNRQIAQTLQVSESTVKNHLHALYSKLGVESRGQAISEAIRRGLATP
ncbi:MAG: response regulator transcription factor [Coriobacteriia bacterium]|nr:response regulator transcription factor [Coriobacteriia bacterium]